MTKVNENGQVEWIFEELDFEGAYEIISEQIDRAVVESDLAFSICEKMLDSKDFTNSNEFKIAREVYTELVARSSKLISVRKNIRILRNWGLHNNA